MSLPVPSTLAALAIAAAVIAGTVAGLAFLF